MSETVAEKIRYGKIYRYLNTVGGMDVLLEFVCCGSKLGKRRDPLTFRPGWTKDYLSISRF